MKTSAASQIYSENRPRAEAGRAAHLLWKSSEAPSVNRREKRAPPTSASAISQRGGTAAHSAIASESTVAGGAPDVTAHTQPARHRLHGRRPRVRVSTKGRAAVQEAAGW